MQNKLPQGPQPHCGREGRCWLRATENHSRLPQAWSARLRQGAHARASQRSLVNLCPMAGLRAQEACALREGGQGSWEANKGS